MILTSHIKVLHIVNDSGQDADISSLGPFANASLAISILTLNIQYSDGSITVTPPVSFRTAQRVMPSLSGKSVH